MKRVAYYDNAKVILIFLVVFGHMIQPITFDSKIVNTLYMWIYTFHMPAFILLAGFFAKGAGNMKYIINLAKKLLVPYIIFQIIYSLFYFFTGHGWEKGLFYPHWSLWFLFSLFSWHLLLILFKKIPAGPSIISALLIGLIVGYFEDVGHLFSLSRTFVFFPFFLMGYWLTKEHMMLVKKKGVKLASFLIMIAVALTIYYAPDFSTGWLLASKSYVSLGLPAYGGLARLFVYMTSIIMIFSVLAWIPTRDFNFFTTLGQRTLYVYLLHGFFVQLFRRYDILMVDDAYHIFLLTVISGLIVLILSSRPVIHLSKPIVEGKLLSNNRLFQSSRFQDRIT